VEGSRNEREFYRQIIRRAAKARERAAEALRRSRAQDADEQTAAARRRRRPRRKDWPQQRRCAGGLRWRSQPVTAGKWLAKPEVADSRPVVRLRPLQRGAVRRLGSTPCG